MAQHILWWSGDTHAMLKFLKLQKVAASPKVTTLTTIMTLMLTLSAHQKVNKWEWQFRLNSSQFSTETNFDQLGQTGFYAEHIVLLGSNLWIVWLQGWIGRINPTDCVNTDNIITASLTNIMTAKLVITKSRQTQDWLGLLRYFQYT